jgi:hypothetical protein
MLWEVVNPSDSYTMEAESFEVAVLAALVMWEGRYSLQALTSETPSMPLMLFRSVHDWVKETFGKTVEELIRGTDRTKVAAACASVLLSKNAEDRKKYDGLTEDEKIALHDKLRGSMNDIGRRAWAMAEGLKNWKVRSCGKS